MEFLVKQNEKRKKHNSLFKLCKSRNLKHCVIFGRVVWDEIFVVFWNMCGLKSVYKYVWNVKIVAQIGIPNGP